LLENWTPRQASRLRATVCLDAQCWRRKAGLFLTRKAEELRKEHPEVLLLNNGEQDGVDLEETFQSEVLNAAEVAPAASPTATRFPRLS